MLYIKKLMGMHNKETYARIDIRVCTKYVHIIRICVVRIYLSCTVVVTKSTIFVFRLKTVSKLFSFCIFLWFQSSLTYHDSCGLHRRLCSYLRQASKGCKLEAECLFLICLELRFSLYCNFWHIFTSSDKVT